MTSTRCSKVPQYRAEMSLNSQKSGSQSLQPMGSLPVKTGIALEGPVVQQFQFANAVDGIAVASAVKTRKGTASPLFVTQDGGRTWSTSEISPITQIRALTSTPYYWYAITSQCPSSHSECFQYQLERAPVSTMHWTLLSIPPALARYGSVMNLTAFGSDVWLSTMNQVSKPYPSYIAIYRNFGRSFSISVQPLLNSVTARRLGGDVLRSGLGHFAMTGICMDRFRTQLMAVFIGL